MKAIYADKNQDGHLSYGELPTPGVKGNNVLIEVHAACINPVDWKTHASLQKLYELGLPIPNIKMGFDLSGVVVKVGPRVNDLKVGDEVYAMSPLPGSYAEYISINARFVAAKPKNLSFEEAAACPMATLTAYQAFKSVKLSENNRVLVIGGSGGVGSIAIQIAKTMGAHVSAVCSTTNVSLVDSLGCDQVIDYKKEDFLNPTDTEQYDVIYDCVGNESIRSCNKILKSNGRFVSIANNGQNRKEIARSYFDMFLGNKNAPIAKTLLAIPTKRHLEKMTPLFESNQIRPIIDSVFDLEDTIEAHAHSQKGRSKGKIVISIKKP